MISQFFMTYFSQIYGVDIAIIKRRASSIVAMSWCYREYYNMITELNVELLEICKPFAYFLPT